jgi:hypothetical protein
VIYQSNKRSLSNRESTREDGPLTDIATSARDDAVRAAYGVTERDRARLRALRTTRPPKIDGRLDEEAWGLTTRSGRFVDLVTGAPSLYDTRVAALWDDRCLYVGYWIEQPFLRSRLTTRDDLVWYDHGDVEFFIAGTDAYYELELNPLGTIYEVLHVWADACTPGGPFDRPEFDPRARAGRGFVGNGDPDRWGWDGLHPRGHRWAFLDWDLPGLQVGVQLQGTLNDDSDVDQGWTVEVAIPWSGIAIVAGREISPAPGDIWRCCFARFDNLELNGRQITPTTGWTLNRHGRYDIHVPETWSLLELSEDPA